MMPGSDQVARPSAAPAGERPWTSVIRPPTGWFDVRLRELWSYRDLIAVFVRRDFISVYSQTILGPLWYIVQPLLTTLVFTVIFGRIAGLSTDGAPQALFYMAGVVAWRYFADCLTKTADTFVSNASLFGKVYFPRLVVPVSVVISNLTAFVVQMATLLAMIALYALRGDPVAVQPGMLALLPLLVIQMAALGLGLGIIASSLTTRYRDLTHLVAFGVQLWMFATPVVYPASRIPERWWWVLALNPMAPIVEAFRVTFLGVGSFSPPLLAASLAVTLLVLGTGILLFSRVEKSFMDTV